MIMSYKPKFCCQCGVSIDRTDWKFSTSRRFCELCEIEFKVQDWKPRIVLVCGVLLTIFGLGTYWRTSGNLPNSSTKSLVKTSVNLDKKQIVQNVEPQISTNRSVQNGEQTQPNSTIKETNLPKSSPGRSLKTKDSEIAATDPEEKLYFCGAQTKKGSPCSRKVKGGGRCWQHLGQPAMLPQEKLIVRQ